MIFLEDRFQVIHVVILMCTDANAVVTFIRRVYVVVSYGRVIVLVTGDFRYAGQNRTSVLHTSVMFDCSFSDDLKLETIRVAPNTK